MGIENRYVYGVDCEYYKFVINLRSKEIWVYENDCIPRLEGTLKELPKELGWELWERIFLRDNGSMTFDNNELKGLTRKLYNFYIEMKK